MRDGGMAHARDFHRKFLRRLTLARPGASLATEANSKRRR